MIQLLRGVAHLHSKSIIHRDIKPSNILYNNCGEVKLCDFGLSRYSINNHERKTPIVVTPFYRAPELFLGKDNYSSEIDLWSCGCILGELFINRPVFEGCGENEILSQIFSVLGIPNEDLWPRWTEPKNFKFNILLSETKSKLRTIFPVYNLDSKTMISYLGQDLLERLLYLNPIKRILAKEALRHPWFLEYPLPKSDKIVS